MGDKSANSGPTVKNSDYGSCVQAACSVPINDEGLKSMELEIKSALYAIENANMDRLAAETKKSITQSVVTLQKLTTALTAHCAMFLADRSVTVKLTESLVRTLTDARRRDRDATNKQLQKMEMKVIELQEEMRAKFASQTRDVAESIGILAPQLEEIKACAGSSYSSVAAAGGWRVATGSRSVTLPMPRPSVTEKPMTEEIFVVPAVEDDGELKEPLAIKKRLQEFIKPQEEGIAVNGVRLSGRGVILRVPTGDKEKMTELIARRTKGLKTMEPRHAQPQVALFNVPGPDAKEKATAACLVATSEVDCTDEVTTIRESAQRNGKFTVVLEVSQEAREILLQHATRTMSHYVPNAVNHIGGCARSPCGASIAGGSEGSQPNHSAFDAATCPAYLKAIGERGQALVN
ncbi:unnamed protein product [Trichogramma brassicae]|uniref:Uncharacterized protein n=1 Tax=Trichogramma brassicae TaxID=86971 RepID=A0A6H5IYD3_9HYME|nr:unnamed protein product [Trichogramma brassicae]